MLGTSHLVLFVTLSIQIRVPLFNDFVHKVLSSIQDGRGFLAQF